LLSGLGSCWVKSERRGMNNLGLKQKIKNFYDIQAARIAAAGRIPKKGMKVILSDDDIKHLQYTAEKLKNAEGFVLAQIEKDLEYFTIWTNFLKDIRGCGPTMASIIISEFDIRKADTVSKMWAYAGLAMQSKWLVIYRQSKKGKPTEKTVWATSRNNAAAVIPMPRNGKETRPIIDSIVPVDGTWERQKRRPGQYPGYNQFLKTKLIGVLGSCFLKSSSPYREFYDNYKNRKTSQNWGGYEDKKTGKLKSIDGHRHNAATRYMVKMFLKDLWVKWRELEGLEVRPAYQEEYLAHTY